MMIKFTIRFLLVLLIFGQNNVQAQSKPSLDTICDVKYEVDNTFDYPNNLICRLSIERRKATRVWLRRKRAVSTGFFIRPNVILTNGHNVASNVWSSVESITVYPGYNKGELVQPAYTIEGKKNVKKIVVVPKKYAMSKSRSKRYPYDYALIFLGDYESPNAGTLELTEIDTLVDETVFTLGYPADMFKDSSNHFTRTDSVNTIGKVQYYTSGDLNMKKNRKSKRQIFFFTCTKGGNSGSPVMVKREGEIKVVGVHNAGHTGVRVTEEVVSTINNWVTLFESGRVPKRDHFMENQ